MNKRYRNPQARKILAYMKDTKTTYAKSKRSGRKAVRKRKAGVHRSLRRSIHQTLQSAPDVAEDIECRVELVRKNFWRKVPDATLVDSLDSAWSGSSGAKANTGYRNSSLREAARRKLTRARGRVQD